MSFDLPSEMMTPAALRASTTAIDRLYALLRKMALDGWQGMQVRKASKEAAKEEETVRNLISLLRQLHAFRSEAISQVEALLDGKVEKVRTYHGSYALVRRGDEIDIFDESISICWVAYDELRRGADVFSVVLGKSYSDLLAIMLRPVFESPNIQNIARSLRVQPEALRKIISTERERLPVIEKITDLLAQYHSTLPYAWRFSGSPYSTVYSFGKAHSESRMGKGRRTHKS
jgi:hypothetical protein